MMSACWHADTEKRSSFSSLRQHLGKMVEAKQQSKYVVFDATSPHCSCEEMESWDETMESESDLDSSEINEKQLLSGKKQFFCVWLFFSLLFFRC